MSPTGNGHVLPAPVAAGPAQARRRAASARRDLCELQRLVRTLQRHVAVDDTAVRRDLELLGEPDAVVRSEPRLRALTALLVTLSTYQQANARARSRRPAGGSGAGAAQTARANGAGVAAVNGTGGAAHGPNGAPVVNGVQANGTHIDLSKVHAVSTDEELAAATARYIARDLAARQLSEFTSAEGYRLARALARLGRVEEPVERLLAEANQVRLHPMPLTDAVSHSPLGR